MILPHNYNRYILRIIYFLLLWVSILTGIAQENESNLQVSGYTSAIQNAKFKNINERWITDNLIHNRINLFYKFNPKFSSAIEFRNRLAFGEEISLNPDPGIMYEYDPGFFDLSTNLVKGNSYVLNTMTDRAWLSYESGKWKTTLGRQRINWGQTFVWNPNDIFNAYSFFDFDYIERPGSDALRVQYYNSEVSSTETAIKLDRNKKITAAALYRFNKSEYDFQFLGGIVSEEDYVLGLGWSGAIKSMSFRGEASWFQPTTNTFNSSGIIMVSTSVDYTFSNSLTLMAEYLFSNNEIPKNVSFIDFYAAPQTIKSISFVRHSFVTQISYPLTPLINTSFAAMFLPGVNGLYMGPTLTYNLAENIDASIVYQGFTAEILNTNQRFHFLFLRLKWNY